MREKKEINVCIGANIQSAREKAGYTQEVLSEALEITPNHLSAIERGVAGISLETLEKLCLYLGITSDSIIFGDMRRNTDSDKIISKLSQIRPDALPHVLRIIDSVLKISESK